MVTAVVPEGPTIVILREQLEQLRGKKILRAEGNAKIDMARLLGRRITAVRSWGKHFLIELPGFAVRVHFLMFGSYTIDTRKDREPRLRIHVAGSEVNFYSCAIRLVEGDLDATYDWSADVMSDAWDAAAAGRKLRAMPEAFICDALLDQTVFSGVGNIIKNEVLFRVREHPLSLVGAMPPPRLRAIIEQARQQDQGEGESQEEGRVIVIGTAGWSIPRRCAKRFASEGTHLQRYSMQLRGVEIDTSFYRRHAVTTYQRWARQTPRNFRFAVKLPRQITHDQHLRASRLPLQEFLADVAGLGSRLGPLIVQLPPSLAFERRVARTFFELLRERHAGLVVCEPRHASWFEAAADTLLQRYRIGRVAADPAVVPAAAEPGGWRGVVYYRLHGSPRMYWSDYEPARLAEWARALRTSPRGQVWCVFDNTAAGAATGNALQLLKMVANSSG